MNELMLQRHSDIVNTLVKWRSLTLRNLHTLIGTNELYDTLRKRVQRLEANGVLKSRFDRRLHKIIYPSVELGHKLGLGNVNEDNIGHDAVVSLIASSLLEFKDIKSIKLPHEYKTKSTWKHHAIEPDAIIIIEKNGHIINVALELELWRKDRKRVFEKFVDYANAYEYDNIFYFFADEPSFNSYKMRLKELIEDSKIAHLKDDFLKKFILIYEPFFSKDLINLRESEIYQNTEKKKLKDLIE